MNGYNFTESVRARLARARDDAVDLKHEYVGTEHLLLGLLGDGGTIADVVIKNLGGDPASLRAILIATVKRGAQNTPGRPDLP